MKNKEMRYNDLRHFEIIRTLTGLHNEVVTVKICTVKGMSGAGITPETPGGDYRLVPEHRMEEMAKQWLRDVQGHDGVYTDDEDSCTVTTTLRAVTHEPDLRLIH